MSVSHKNQLDLTIMVSCFNEGDVIEQTLELIRDVMSCFDYSYEVLIYDDASSDNSVEIVKSYIDRNHLGSQFFLVVNSTNMGLGFSYFRAAEKGRGEYFLKINGRNAHPPNSLKKVLKCLGQADVVIPYFKTRLFKLKDNDDYRSFGRRLLSLSFAGLIRTVSGLNVRYFNGGVIHKRENVIANQVATHGFGYQAELLCKLLKKPEVKYLEVSQENFDEAGSSTALRIKNIYSVFGSFWRIFWGRFFPKN